MTKRRDKIYDSLSWLGQSLLDELYGSKRQYINSLNDHPLEDYIISYDTYVDNEGMIISLGERIGFNLNYNVAYIVAEQFYDRCSFLIRHSTHEDINTLMNMTEIDYYNLLKKKKYQIYL